MQSTEPPYSTLTPDAILDAIESQGFRCSGQFLALNSYENRVYQIGIEDDQPLIAKFYRPQRWQDAQILEEHAFSLELAEREIPIIAPIADEQDNTLFYFRDFRFALFPRRGGRWPELDNADNLMWLGRFIARIHAVGSIGQFQSRPRISVKSMGDEALESIEKSQFLPDYLAENYVATAQALIKHVEEIFDGFGPFRFIRLHGDCHPGNILWTDNGPHFVDLDDSLNGPAIQDLWMLLSGDRENQSWQLKEILNGYYEFNDFDPLELNLIEALRTLRMINYSAWLARRWHDPAFPMAFPWFETPRYWEEQLNTLREQQERLFDPPLRLR